MESPQRAKRLYTTHEVARLLGVTPITVIRWIENGKFKCYTTVGGHRRIQYEELVRFARAYQLPWQGEEGLGEKRKEFVVLAVDDEPNIIELLRDMLASVPNLFFVGVTNAFSAGAKLVEERPDLILLDFRMPELDGFEFCRFVRLDPRFKDIPVIAVTALRSPEDQGKMKDAGVNDFLFKPFTVDLILQKIEPYKKLKDDGNPQNSQDAPAA